MHATDPFSLGSPTSHGDFKKERQPLNLDSFHLFKHFPTEIQSLIWEHALPDARIIELQVTQLECLVLIKERSEVIKPVRRCDRHNWTAFWTLLLQRTFQRQHRKTKRLLDSHYHYRRVEFLDVSEKTPVKPSALLSTCSDSRRVALNSLVHRAYPWSEEEIRAKEYRYMLPYELGRPINYHYITAGGVIPIDKLIPSSMWYNPGRDTLYLKESNVDRISLEKLGFRDIQSLAVTLDIWDSLYLRQCRSEPGITESYAIFPNIKELLLVNRHELYRPWTREQRRLIRRAKMTTKLQDSLISHINIASHQIIKLLTESELLGEKGESQSLETAEPWVESYHQLDGFEN